MREKPALVPHAEAKPIATEAPIEPEKSKPAGPFSTTARAEELPPPRAPIAPEDRKAGEAKLVPLQKEYDDLAAQVKDAKLDPLKANQLLRRKGDVTREIVKIKREYGIKD